MRIKIIDRFFEVVLTSQGGKDHGMNSSGQASHWFQKIWIDTDDRPFDGIEADLWHEILEMIDKNLNLKIDHQDITALGVAIHQVLEDNKQFFSEFYGEIVKLKEGKC